MQKDLERDLVGKKQARSTAFNYWSLRENQEDDRVLEFPVSSELPVSRGGAMRSYLTIQKQSIYHA